MRCPFTGGARVKFQLASRTLTSRAQSLRTSRSWVRARFPSFADLVVLAGSLNPIPSRTRPLNSPAPMILSLKAWKSRSLPGLPKTENLLDTMTDTENPPRQRGGFLRLWRYWRPPESAEHAFPNELCSGHGKHPVKAAGWRSRATLPALMPRYAALVRQPNSTAGIPRACGPGVRRCEPARQRAMLAGPRR